MARPVGMPGSGTPTKSRSRSTANSVPCTISHRHLHKRRGRGWRVADDRDKQQSQAARQAGAPTAAGGCCVARRRSSGPGSRSRSITMRSTDRKKPSARTRRHAGSLIGGTGADRRSGQQAPDPTETQKATTAPAISGPRSFSTSARVRSMPAVTRADVMIRRSVDPQVERGWSRFDDWQGVGVDESDSTYLAA